MPVVAKTEAQKEAIRALWARGVLTWKLDAAQKVLHTEIAAAQAAGKPRFSLCCSRRWGKTYLLAVRAIEHALRTPGAQIAFVSRTKRGAREIAEKIIRSLVSDCPTKLKPSYHRADFRWDFANDAAIYFMGTDSGHYERARGREFHMVIFDEAGFIDLLDEIIQEVFAPTLLTTNGFMLLASTPPKKTSHPFVKIYRTCLADGASCLKTIFDNPRLTPLQIQRAKGESGGEGTPYWRREFLCEFIDEDNNVVIPEWTQKRAYGTPAIPATDVFPGAPEVPPLVLALTRPEYCDKYVSLDLGFRDLTVALFAWYDFKNARIVIEDELVLQGKETTTAALAGSLAVRMQDLWGPADRRQDKGNVYQVSDVDPRLIFELRTLHGLKFQQTAKDNKDAQINQIRLMVGAGQLVIDPKCKVLIRTLFTATWDKNHKTYERNEKDEIGHADALDALIYLCRNIRKNRNPAPDGHHWTEEHNVTRPKPMSSAMKALSEALSGGQPPKDTLQAKVQRGGKIGMFGGLRRL